MKIKLKKQFLKNKAGAIVNVESNIAKALIDKGDAIMIDLDDIKRTSMPFYSVRDY